MPITKRKDTIEKFSTFLVLINQESYLGKWHIDVKLRKNMERILDDNQIEEEFLARSFLNTTKINQDKLCSLHLSAYLQEIGFYAAKKVFQRVGNITLGLTWQDYYGFAAEKIAQPELLLSKYNPNREVKIVTYAQNKLEGKIADSAYSSLGWRLCSDWGLLRKMSKKAGRKALEEIGGLMGKSLEQHLIIWQCFQVIYAPNNNKNSRKLSPPTETQYKKISEQYNLMMVEKINTEVAKIMLATCIDVARKYYNPQTIGYPENFDLADTHNNLIESLQEENKHQQLQNINNILNEAINILSQEEQILLQLWKGLKITQKDIVTFLKDNFLGFVTQQYEISRKGDRAKKKILEYLIKTLLNDGSKLTKEKLDNLKNPFNSCLESYFIKNINKILEQLYQQYQEINQENLILFLEENLKAELSQQWKLKHCDYDFLDKRINDFIKNWLQES